MHGACQHVCLPASQNDGRGSERAHEQHDVRGVEAQVNGVASE